MVHFVCRKFAIPQLSKQAALLICTPNGAQSGQAIHTANMHARWSKWPDSDGVGSTGDTLHTNNQEIIECTRPLRVLIKLSCRLVSYCGTGAHIYVVESIYCLFCQFISVVASPGPYNSFKMLLCVVTSSRRTKVPTQYLFCTLANIKQRVPGGFGQHLLWYCISLLVARMHVKRCTFVLGSKHA